MPDLFAPDPEPHPPAAPPKPEKPHAPAWVSGCKSGVLTVLTFFFLLALMFGMCAGFIGVHNSLQQLDKKIDEIQNDVNGLKKKPDDKKVMPPAGD